MTGCHTTWCTVDTGFQVGSRKGEFVGAVDAAGDEGVLAFGPRGEIIGMYRELDLAKAAVEADFARSVPG